MNEEAAATRLMGLSVMPTEIEGEWHDDAYCVEEGDESDGNWASVDSGAAALESLTGLNGKG